MTIEDAYQKLTQLQTQINQNLIGQEQVVNEVIIALLCNGHVLVEGVPGLGKTLLVSALAKCFAAEYKRIQFTPDLMPSDITGHVFYNAAESKFRMRKGPVFTNLLLADEINRAPAKTQAALLEVMQEKQVTLEGTTHTLPYPFMVMATQNPVEQDGTYPLPEAELDRFIMKILIDYPEHHDEIHLTKTITTGFVNDKDAFSQQEAVLNTEDLLAMQHLASQIAIDDAVLEYAVKLVRQTRLSSALHIGAGTRACIALVRAARAHALLRRGEFVTPDDVKTMAIPVTRHRVSLSAEVEIDGLTVDQVLLDIFNSVDAPRL